MPQQESSSAEAFQALCKSQRSYFLSGATHPYEFRKAQLQKLKEILKIFEQDILDALHKDLGKPEFEAYASEIGFVHEEINVCLKRLKKWMQPKKVKTPVTSWPSKSRVLSEPKGVCLIIAPWNYPFQLVIAPLIAAISAGNTAVVKPSEQTPHTAAIIEKLLTQFDKQYIAVVQGEGEKVVPELMQNFRFDHVFFTGSVPVGRKVAEMAAAKLTPATLELGGKSPAIVDETAKLNVSAKRIAFGKWLNAGQTCVAPDYLLVHKNLKDRLVAEMQKVLEEFYADRPLEDENYTRIINKKHFDRLTSYLSEGKILTGGDFNVENLRIAPTILEGVSLEDKIMQEEIFGPILPVLTFEDKDQALAIIRKNPYPLSFYIFTKSKSFEQFFLKKLQFGSGAINNSIVQLSNPDLPFGGVGSSGYGSYHGKAGFDTFTYQKSVMKSATWFDLKQKYPPYTKAAYKLIKRVMR